MDIFLLLVPALALGWVFKVRQQQRRIALLAGFLSRYNIEKNIEAVTQGYLRALGESDPVRRDQVWAILRGQEEAVCTQIMRLAEDIEAADPALTQVSKLPFWTPFGPGRSASFDLREALRVHGRGVCRAVMADMGNPRDRAYAISAELLLMQHTCHWFCRSKLVASARMLSRHSTSYEQVVDSVLPQTRAEYLGLVALGAQSG